MQRSPVSRINAFSGAESPSDTPIHALSVLIALSMAALHLLQTAFFILPSDQIKNLHLGLGMIIVFLAASEGADRPRKMLTLMLAALTLVPMLYIHGQYTALVTERIFGPTTLDVVISTMLIALALIASYMSWGLLFTAISAAALAYGYFGYLMPGDLLFHAGISWPRLASYAAIPSFQGLLGSLTDLSASVIFIFMLFVGLLKATGGMDFVMIAGHKLSGTSRAGPAQLAVISSGLMGMISGSTVANVASTGGITIRLMKRFGYSGEQAGAIEAVASTGGQFAPPIMGLTAFLIVGMTGIPYAEIMAAAIFPALIYYIYLLVSVHFFAVAKGIGRRPAEASGSDGAEMDMPLAEAARRYGHILIGIAVLVYFLVTQLPPAHSALIAILTIMATETLKQLWTHRDAPLRGLAEAAKTILRGLDGGAREGAQLAVVIAVIGILVDILVVTGFAQKLSFSLLSVADDRLWLLLIMSAFACVVFGLGMPTPAAYILVALLGVPALINFGIPVLAAHMFVFFFANMSAITPPVAVAALVAAKIAGANYMRTAVTALRLGLPGFILPFLFVYQPEILGLQGNLAHRLLVFVIALIGLQAVNLSFMRRLYRPFSPTERVLLFVGGIAVVWPALWISVVGLGLVAAGIARQFISPSEPLPTH